MASIAENPIISIVVITYNSSEFLVETLESIYKQTYKNIELIISDDCSTDNTIELCEQWIKQYGKRFILTDIVTSKKNTGVAANCNRGYSAASGEWIKGIAGDDILLPNCIESYINYIESNTDISICVSKARCFHKSLQNDFVYGNIIPSIENQHIYELNAIDQLKILLKGNIIVTPTMFLKREIFLNYPFNELYRYMEDIPFLINITKNNIKIHFLDEVTVLYRFTTQSLSQTRTKFFPTRMFETKAIYFLNEKKELMRTYSPNSIKVEQRRLILWGIVEHYLKNDASSFINRVIYRILNFIIK